ncbi:MAG TPA: hypothetical protein VGF06_06290 [Terriglobales bacterium]|jgi:hypothetical protein
MQGFKQGFKPFLTSLLLGVLLTTVPAWGQSLRLRVEVPFRFVAGGKSFAPGEYFVIRVAPNTVELRDSDYRFLGFIAASEVQAREPHRASVVVFQPQGGERVLKQVWAEGTQQGYELSTGKAPASMALQGSGKQTASAISTGR